MKLTDKVLLGSVAGLLAYEGYTLINKEPEDTISESVWRVEKSRPVVPFLVGLLCGHLFFSRVPDDAVVKAVIEGPPAEKPAAV